MANANQKAFFFSFRGKSDTENIFMLKNQAVNLPLEQNIFSSTYFLGEALTLIRRRLKYSKFQYNDGGMLTNQTGWQKINCKKLKIL